MAKPENSTGKPENQNRKNENFTLKSPDENRASFRTNGYLPQTGKKPELNRKQTGKFEG
ncbi:MAG TPA: hypothetical protein PKY58_04875 [Syntrophales bacterium]|nr:hypothetical protein [Syntrophales bacterium]HQN77988.1 hypothetical protein [Syntrophales bacterium]HQQ26840.1 hypothetical protein [Syntrophales bacterium]